MINEGDKSGSPVQYPFISEEADEVLEQIFAAPDGISAARLAQAMRLVDCSFLLEELDLAGIHVRRERRGGEVFYLAPLARGRPEGVG